MPVTKEILDTTLEETLELTLELPPPNKYFFHKKKTLLSFIKFILLNLQIDMEICVSKK